jgi:hypothetical protein
MHTSTVMRMVHKWHPDCHAHGAQSIAEWRFDLAGAHA